MPHSIAETRIVNPMWYFERNFEGIRYLLKRHDLHVTDRACITRGDTFIYIDVAERSRYTMLLHIEHRFHLGSAFLTNLVFKVRVYLDAALAEVIAYQGHHNLKPRYPYPNEEMLHPDEKRQANLLLHEWLSTWTRAGRQYALSTG